MNKKIEVVLTREEVEKAIKEWADKQGMEVVGKIRFDVHASYEGCDITTDGPAYVLSGARFEVDE